MDLKQEIEAATGATLAHTALLASLIGVLRQRGVLNDALINIITDSALTQVESLDLQPEHAMRARRILEVIAIELAGPPKDAV